MLLDNQSTVHIFWNTLFLVNVRRMTKCLELLTNTGSTIINEIGELPGVGTIWVHWKCIANILSFHGVQEVNKFEIDYSSRPKIRWVNKTNRSKSRHHSRFTRSLSLMVGVYTTWAAVILLGPDAPILYLGKKSSTQKNI